MKNHPINDIRFPEFPTLIANRVVILGGRILYEIFFVDNHKHYIVATLQSGLLDINITGSQSNYTSIRRAMKRVYNEVVLPAKKYSYKDVSGLYAYKNRREKGSYDIHSENVGLGVAHLDGFGNLKIGKERLYDQKLSLHNAIRLTFLKLQKPIVRNDEIELVTEYQKSF